MVARKKVSKKRVDAVNGSVEEAGKYIGSWLKVLLAVVVVVLILIIFGGGGSAIESGSNVTLHYTGILEDGTVFDSSFDKDPINFIVGAGSVIKGFEDEIIGMKKGDEKSFVVLKDNAYGNHDPNKIGSYPRSSIPDDMDVAVEDIIYIQMEDGRIGIARILDIDEQTVLLDLNHPLVGHDLTYKVNILLIE
ncbi:MAG: peptidylprolyl isomerase [Nanoarchaeota archaeon]|nr:peptidylprolyl isomerase [Nanoarchaeota archaeon]